MHMTIIPLLAFDVVPEREIDCFWSGEKVLFALPTTPNVYIYIDVYVYMVTES